MGKLIVFTGIDGAGKSTLVDRLENEGVLPGAAFLRKKTKLNVGLVRRFHTRNFDDALDWTFGSFAEAAAIATCFDFLSHYDRNIAPRLEDHDLVVCDRYALCYEAYLKSTGSRFDSAALLAKVAVPDLVVHVAVPVPVAASRFRARLHRSEDEDERVIARFGEAYDQLLPSVRSKAILDNDRPLDETWGELLSFLRTFQAADVGESEAKRRHWK